MSQFEQNVLEYIVEDIMKDFDRGDYNPDKFYDDAVTHLSAYGYDISNEVIWEFDEHEASDIQGTHLEIIAEIKDEEDSEYLRFVLEDGRPGKQAPALDRVRGLEDFEYGV